MKFVCITCDRKFDAIPDGASQISPGERRVNTFRFTDGTIHSLRKVRGLTEGFHRRWHKNSRPDCVYFNPPLPEPIEQKELLQEATEVPEESQPVDKVKQVVTDEPEIEEVEPATTMAVAFHRIFKS